MHSRQKSTCGDKRVGNLFFIPARPALRLLLPRGGKDGFIPSPRTSLDRVLCSYPKHSSQNQGATRSGETLLLYQLSYAGTDGQAAGLEPASNVVSTAFAPKNEMRRQNLGNIFRCSIQLSYSSPFGGGGRIRTGNRRITCSYPGIRRKSEVTTKLAKIFTRSTIELWPRLVEPPGLEPGTSSSIRM